MPKLAFGREAYRRDQGNLPELKLVNMYVEASPTASEGVVLQSREGMTETTALGSGPIKGMFSASGVFNQDLFAVSGSTLYRGAASVGTVSGGGPLSFAASPSALLMTLGASAYLYNGTTTAAEAFPDAAPVTAVAYLTGYFIGIRQDTHRFYWRRFDVATWDGLDYASAESARDNLLDVHVIQDGLWLCGADTIEFWSPTGISATPFMRVESRLYRKGVIATGCAAEVDNTLFWWGSDNAVYRGGEVPQRVSTSGIDERLERSTATRGAFKFALNGHEFFCVRTDEGTFAYDAATQQWCEFASFGRTNWRAANAAVSTTGLVFGDDTSGQIWSFGGWADGPATLERRFTSAFSLTGGAPVVSNMLIDANVGQTTDLAADPVMEIRSSRDGGNVWGEWRQVALGRRGEFRTRAVLRRLGMFDPPGALFEHKVTDAAPLRVSGVAVNEPMGGRGR